MLTMLDLFCGFGGASAAMRDRGWRVVGVDIEPAVGPTVVADVERLPLRPFHCDLIWASPPCTYYSRFDQPGIFPNEPTPDHALYNAARTVIAEWQPTWWVIENVRGAARFWGKPDYRFGPQLLWTNLPMLARPVFPRRRKHNLCAGNDPLRGAKRGYIPRPISEVVADAVEYLSEQNLPRLVGVEQAPGVVNHVGRSPLHLNGMPVKRDCGAGQESGEGITVMRGAGVEVEGLVGPVVDVESHRESLLTPDDNIIRGSCPGVSRASFAEIGQGVRAG